jgi:hypothetical protein
MVAMAISVYGTNGSLIDQPRRGHTILLDLLRATDGDTRGDVEELMSESSAVANRQQ